LQRTPTAGAPGDDLPFPLAALRAMVSTRRTAFGRVKSLLDGIETALRFVVAIEVAALRESEAPRLDQEAAELLVEQAHPGDPWEICGLTLARLIPGTQESAITRMARGLSSAKVQGPLTEALRQAIDLRRS